MTPQFVDISAWQPQKVDWQAYKAWSAQGDGVSRVAMRSSYGVGYEDQHFAIYRDDALTAGIDVIIMYHYAYPSLNSPSSEASSQFAIVGNIRPQDIVFLDIEENVPQATADWAYAWLVQQEMNYGKLPGLYASSAYIQQRLRDPRLEPFALWEANWQFTPDERPPVPYPWKTRSFLQYTDRAVNVPGVPGTVDCNIFLGGTIPMPQTSQVPAGWSDDGHTLTAPNHIPVVLGFRDKVLTANPPWSPDNWPMRAEYHADPVEQSHPSLGAGPAQEFRWDRLAGCATLGIYKTWLGQELYWYQQQYALLLLQIADLQEKLAELQPAALVAENAALKAQIAQAVKDLS